MSQRSGLAWPGRGAAPGVAERTRLLQYERLMGLGHVTAVALAVVAAELNEPHPTQEGAFAALMLATVVYALGYHLVLPRWWCSRGKVLLGLAVDTLLTTAAVRLTGYHASLLVFLYYVVVAAAAATLDRRTTLGICALVTVCFGATLTADPALSGAAAQVVVFVASVWLVGALCSAATANLRAGERRLLQAVSELRAVAEENSALSQALAMELDASQRLLSTLQRERRQTQRLADMVLSAQEDERGRLARELHDEANQLMAALMNSADAAERIGLRHGDEELAQALGRLRRIAAAALGDLQRIAHELRPPALDEFGLIPALQRLAGDRGAAVTVEGRERRLDGAVEVALYRIAQEALTNAARHAGARTVRLRLRFADDSVRLDVSDDGCGFTGAAEPSGLGLPGMRERAALVGGSVEISSRPGGGTRVSAYIPLSAPLVAAG